MSFRLRRPRFAVAARRNLPGHKDVISTGERFSVRSGEISPGYVSDTLCTAPRSVRSPASTLRRIGSKSPKHRTREEGAGKGEFAFTECRNFYYSLAQNRGFCAKEEPQA